MAKTSTKTKTPALIGTAKEPRRNSVRELNELRASGDYAATIDGTQTMGRVNLDRKSLTKFTPEMIKEKMAILFPDVETGETPLDCLVIVQELMVPGKSGAIINPYTENDQAVMSIGKIRGIGPLAFRWDVTNELFQGGESFKIGDIVRMPKSGGQEFLVDGVIFNLWKDRDIKTVITDLRKVVGMYF